MRMIETGVSGVDFVVINTDAQALSKFEGICTSVNIGAQVTRGLGAGGLPVIAWFKLSTKYCISIVP